MARTKRILRGGAEAARQQAERADRVIRDREVPELGRRRRGERETWVVHLKAGGKRSKVTLGACAAISLPQARALARDMLVADAPPPAPDPATRVKDFAPRFLADSAGQWKASTQATNAQAVRIHILPTFGGWRLDGITAQDVRSWLTSQVSAGARARALPVLSALMRHAELTGMRPPGSNPCKGLRRRKSAFKARALSGADFAALGAGFEALELAHPEAISALRFLALTGARKGEVLGLKWAMIDGPRAVLPDAKSGPKTIRLSPPVLQLLANRPRTGDFVFSGTDAPLPAHRLDRVWRLLRTRLERPDLRIHDLRHAYASVAATMGVDLLVIGGLLGHADKGSTAGYAHLAEAEIAAASARVGAHLSAIRKTRKPRKSIFRDFATGKDSLGDFCAGRGLDPEQFQKDLVTWRASQRRAAR